MRKSAKSSGLQGATLKSLERCHNFKHTHCFLLQLWEVLFRETLNAYIVNRDTNNLNNNAKCILSNAIQENHSPDHLIQQIEISQLLEDLSIEENFYQRTNR